MQKGMMILERINVIMFALPNTIKSYVIANADQTYTIVLNSNLSHEQNMKSYAHEIDHINNGDYDKKCSVDIIEINAHSA